MSKKLQYLVIHSTDTPAGRAVSSAEIRRWHTSPPPAGNGWKQVGYTDMFHLDGTVERLVSNNEDDVIDAWEVTNGVAGINQISRHIVYVGGKPTDTRTAQQKNALAAYVLDFVKRFPEVKVAGHYQFANKANKACPSFKVPEWCREIGVHEKNINN